MDAIVLSDDEAVGLAVLVGQPWPSPLPTVDVLDADQLAAAGRRGIRALAIRSLVRQRPAASAAAGGTSADASAETDGDRPQLARPLTELAARVFAGRPQAMLYAADDDLSWYPAGLTAVYFGSAAEWTMQVVSPGGVNYFSTIAAADAMDGIGALVRAAYENGLDGPSLPQGAAAPTQLCVSRPAGAQPRTLAVGQGTCAVHCWDSATGQHRPDDPPADLAAAQEVLWS